ncbi:MAG: hypothetical protein RMI30_06830 [Thermodesulfovibrio sp.]|nr:hypothetical protein [Thermodesulfovibrio sp.]
MKSFLILSIFLLIVNLTFAIDKLFLSGKIIGYEPETGKITIEVYSNSCKGVRNFLTEKGLPKALIINKEVGFGIDSDHCDKFKIHRIITPLLN